MIDMPPECPPGMTLMDVITVHAQHIADNTASGGYPCFIQTPDNLKGHEPKGYPYFDFESARKQNAADSGSLQSAGISSSEFYLVILLGGITFISFVTGFATGFLYME
ncbi:hypothetical protein LEI94_12110 [Salmonella enterica]|uniref:hypothetical protein n=1 Tax=Salmonella sp. SAL04162 TaxID=3159782 RepID=UPI002A1948C5|nr:hypothetical protein [Salmonella enterica]MDJ6365818.1 hypothetical protein [Salmonella enterica]